MTFPTWTCRTCSTCPTLLRISPTTPPSSDPESLHRSCSRGTIATASGEAPPICLKSETTALLVLNHLLHLRRRHPRNLPHHLHRLRCWRTQHQSRLSPGRPLITPTTAVAE